MAIYPSQTVHHRGWRLFYHIALIITQDEELSVGCHGHISYHPSTVLLHGSIVWQPLLAVPVSTAVLRHVLWYGSRLHAAVCLPITWTAQEELCYDTVREQSAASFSSSHPACNTFIHFTHYLQRRQQHATTPYTVTVATKFVAASELSFACFPEMYVLLPCHRSTSLAH